MIAKMEEPDARSMKMQHSLLKKIIYKVASAKITILDSRTRTEIKNHKIHQPWKGNLSVWIRIGDTIKLRRIKAEIEQHK